MSKALGFIRHDGGAAIAPVFEILGGGAEAFQGMFWDEPPPLSVADCEMETTVCQVSDVDGDYQIIQDSLLESDLDTLHLQGDQVPVVIRGKLREALDGDGNY
jgi:hypothetical protein